MATLKELRQIAKEKHIPSWWNKNTKQLTEELAELEKSNISKKDYRKCVVGDISLTRYCEEHDLPYNTIYDRIFRLGWPFEKAISAPVRKKGSS